MYFRLKTVWVSRGDGVRGEAGRRFVKKKGVEKEKERESFVM